MPQVDFLPVAISGNANVDTQAEYAGSSYQENGFQTGVAKSTQLNKCWRQGTVIASVIANFIANTLNEDVLDNGNTATLIAQLTAAIEAIANAAGTPKVVAVAGSAAPVLDCSQGNSLFVCFEIQLNQNMSPTITNFKAGQLVSINWISAVNGGFTVTWPNNTSGGGDTSGLNSVTGLRGNQLFIVGTDNNLHATTAMTMA